MLLPATGTTTWTLAFPATNLTADGSYTVRAVATDSVANTASASVSFTVESTAPTVTALVFTNGNGDINGDVDEVRITYSKPLKLSTICLLWTGPGDRTLSGAGLVVTITDQPANEPLTITSTACTLHVGTVATGANWTASGATFNGTPPKSKLTWTAATNTLTIHLGVQVTGGALLNQPTGATVGYTPDTAITDMAGNPISATQFTATGQRF